ncbi:MAG: zf-HC2 domain-containing protein [Elusimicrobiota bacterium]|nr:zf-HC2 domain-containing protein [Elusimicrobiota bacterium]
MNCGYGEKLILYFYGEAAEDMRAGVKEHLAGCAACRGELAALKAAEGRLSGRAPGPSAATVEAVMLAARAAVSRGSVFSFNWGETLLSGALASLLVAGFIFSGSGVPADLAWNSGLDSGLDSVEYSMYQAKFDMASVSSDWEYKCSALEDESLAEKNMKAEG